MMRGSEKMFFVIKYFKSDMSLNTVTLSSCFTAIVIVSQFINSVYVYRDYTLEIEFNVSFEDFRTMSTECEEQGSNKQPVVYVTA